MAATPRLKRQHLRASHRDSEEAELREAIQTKLAYALGKTREAATDVDWYHATVLAVRDRVIDTFLNAHAEAKRAKRKRVYYLSIEFLIGRLLFDTLTNLQLVEPARAAPASLGADLARLRASVVSATLTTFRLVGPARAALASLGADLDRLREIEPDAALGSGGLGR